MSNLFIRALDNGMILFDYDNLKLKSYFLDIELF